MHLNQLYVVIDCCFDRVARRLVATCCHRETPMRPTPVITAATMTPEMRLSASVKPSASLFLLDLFRSGDARSFMFISALLGDEWLDREPLEESI